MTSVFDAARLTPGKPRHLFARAAYQMINGFPYSIGCYANVAPMLAERGCRCAGNP